MVSKALRLNLFRLHDAGRDRAARPVELPEVLLPQAAVVRTMRIEGMMCGHCEAMVKRVLEAIDGVESAVPSHTEGTAIVTLSAPVDENQLRKAVEDEDYTVVAIE